jgi:hypothetical protein
MDLHPYDTERHDITHHNNYHARMYSLIHDGPVMGMPIMRLGLMYIIRCFKVMACLGFQLC